ncbi:putative plant disease resistance response protein [Medicago truncatula]|uniref:Dirigent protein n=1 Tax=Medicago truncatula TaxID=3880 RepID=A0A072ULY3_MEDTR|nr:dirigent protein 10 [Medicago truncatula]KEH30098.1 disease resistance-responsive, dirigent domain protein [Medicago truncatula]RHN60889.1 putative plant disease resistance response protein [Medicago truncatula]
MARFETFFTTMPLKSIMLMALILFLTLTSTTSTRILSEQETPEEPIVDSAESPVSSTILPPLAAPTTATTTSTDIPDQHHTLSFFMHDILGGSNPTARAVTGVVTNPALNAQVAFAKPNGANLPLNNGVPQNNNNNGILNNNNLPFLTGLSGNTGNVFNNNNNGNNNFPVTNMNQIPQGTTVQELMFGTMTVFDDELTEGEELGSGLVGKAQGFYIASSTEGTSQVMAFTAKFEENGYEDSLSFFGVHRTTQVSQSQLAIIGGTGKYVNANGFAIIKTFPVNGQQHNTDGLETLLHLTAYLSY